MPGSSVVFNLSGHGLSFYLALCTNMQEKKSVFLLKEEDSQIWSPLLSSNKDAKTKGL